MFTDTDDYFVEGRTFAITIAETLHLKAPPPVPTDPDDIADAKEAAADLHMSHTEIGARSPYYGLLLYSTHKLGTLWLTALVQSFFGAWLAFLFWRTAAARGASRGPPMSPRRPSPSPPPCPSSPPSPCRTCSAAMWPWR